MKNYTFYNISCYNDKDFEKNNVRVDYSKLMHVFNKSPNVNNNPIKY